MFPVIQPFIGTYLCRFGVGCNIFFMGCRFSMQRWARHGEMGYLLRIGDHCWGGNFVIKAEQ